MIQRRIIRSETLEEATRCLCGLLAGGFDVAEDGELYETRVLVERFDGLRMVIHTREHGPPHFHVIASGIDASFAIHDCSHLAGSITAKDRRIIEYWHAQARPLLIRVWNETRPSDCPVGPIVE